MRKRLVCVIALSVGAWFAAGDLAEGSCAGSRIWLAAQPSGMGRAIPVTWVIEPACDLIETGLLLGTNPASLAPVGQPIYGPRAIYQQAISVSESGAYYVAAYVRDEGDGWFQSPPSRVDIAVAPIPPTGSPGSHGAPSSYTGTDEDFLRPAGQPHFASLRHARRERKVILFADTPFWLGETSRTVASTHREEVLAEQDQVEVRGVTVRIGADPAGQFFSVGRALDLLDADFHFFGYPRPGLYVVECTGFVQFGGTQTSSACNPSLPRPLFGFVGLEYQEFPEVTFPQSVRSSATYFIPRPPPGARLQRAVLRALVQVVWGDIAAVRLQGKLPTAIAVVSCHGGFPNCIYRVTWDFTEEARALAAQGGGLLELTADPIPPVVLGDLRRAWYFFFARANYPWLHGFGGDGDLEVRFEADCPKELKVTVTPDSVRTQLPTSPTTETATVTALVKTCPAQSGSAPASVEVTFEVLSAPTDASTEAGGHDHNTQRPKGTLKRGGQAATSCTVPIDATGMGTCSSTLEYHPSAVSGVEKIVAEATGFNKDEKNVTVRILGLVNLAAVQSNFFRLTGQTSTHPDNHWGTPNVVSNTQPVAFDYLEHSCNTLGTCATLGINDMSLRQGGLFDVCATWDPGSTCTIDGRSATGHRSHRIGTGVDIDREACLDPNLSGGCSSRLSVRRDFIEAACERRGRARMANEPTFHCEWPR